MFYRKNVGNTERWVRVLGGCLMAGCGLVLFGASALGLVVAGCGAFTSATGVFGFCPACAAVGRSLPAAPDTGHNGPA